MCQNSARGLYKYPIPPGGSNSLTPRYHACPSYIKYSSTKGPVFKLYVLYVASRQSWYFAKRFWQVSPAVGLLRSQIGTWNLWKKTKHRDWGNATQCTKVCHFFLPFNLCLEQQIKKKLDGNDIFTLGWKWPKWNSKLCIVSRPHSPDGPPSAAAWSWTLCARAALRRTPSWSRPESSCPLHHHHLIEIYIF